MTSDERAATWEAMTQAQHTAMKKSLDDRARDLEKELAVDIIFHRDDAQRGDILYFIFYILYFIFSV